MLLKRNNIALLGLDFFCWSFCVILALYLGSDINWDLMNYHLYGVDLQFNRSVNQDFMAASMQGYLSAVPYIPVYAMVKAGFSSTSTLVVLASLQSANLMIVHRIFDVAYTGLPSWRWIGRILSVGLAGAAAVFWLELGSSLADSIVSIPLLIAVWQWLRAVQGFGRMERLTLLRVSLMVALCLGVASGLKLTAAVWVVPILLHLALQESDWFARAKLFAILCAVALIGYLLINGWWSFVLWEEFGNPLFPFFNGIFKSPDVVQGVFQHQRFIPESVAEAVLMPWRMMQLGESKYLESFALDIRPIVFFSLLIWWAVSAVAKSDIGLLRAGANRAWGALLGLIVIEWCVWLWSSGNGRYAMPILILIGPAMVLLWFGLVRSRRIKLYGALGVLLLQYGSNCNGGIERWGPAPFQNEFAHITMPDDLKESPHLFVSLQNQSLSFLSGQVHPDSAFVNLIGQIPLRRGGPGWSRVESILNRHRGEFWTLQALPAGVSSDDLPVHIKNNIRVQKALLLPYSMSINEGRCKFFRLWGGGLEGGAEMLYDRVLACPGSHDESNKTGGIASWMPALNAANDVFAEVERLCPRVHRGMGATTRYLGYAYVRQYVNTDITVSIASSRFGLRANDFHGQINLDKCLSESHFRKFQLEDDRWRKTPQYQSALGSVGFYGKVY